MSFPTMKTPFVGYYEVPERSRKWKRRVIVGGVVASTGAVAIWGMMGQSQPDPVRIAFIGNSFQFVNDFPRFLPRLASKRIEQDSVLHGSLSLVTLLQKGNGMRTRWQTDNAWDESLGLYDYGACTIPQLLVGHDEALANYNEYYINDGLNPCFAWHHNGAAYDDDFVDDDSVTDDSNNNADDDSDIYLQYTLATKSIPNKTWDYVVLNDQSVRPAIPSKRSITARVLNSTYIPLFLESQATPILIATYGYWRDNLNVTALYGIQDVPHFTAKLYWGYKVYATTLEIVQARIAPVGIAFLVVWEENFQLWERFFGKDQYHPSPIGTYLMGCVVHATIFGQLPEPPMTADTSYYFETARSMQLSGSSSELESFYPTEEEALYLRWIAKRVVFDKYRPSSFRQAWKLVQEEEGNGAG